MWRIGYELDRLAALPWWIPGVLVLGIAAVVVGGCWRKGDWL
jgi:hypothetical protein